MEKLRVCGTRPHKHTLGLASGLVALGHYTGSAVQMVGRTWQPGQMIAIGFLDGSRAQRDKVRRWAAEWLKYANLNFLWDAKFPMVRVSFAIPDQSWSLIGTDCLGADPGEPTVNLGWVTDTSDDESDRAVIVHEFGHMLGLGHEQSSPVEDIQWNRPVALTYYEQTQGWDATTVESNVFEVFSQADVNATDYDRASIMQYPVPAELTLDGRGIGWNTDLSPVDKLAIAAIYPPMPAKSVKSRHPRKAKPISA